MNRQTFETLAVITGLLAAFAVSWYAGSGYARQETLDSHTALHKAHAPL